MAQSKAKKQEPMEAPQGVTMAQPMSGGMPPPQYAPLPGQPTGSWAQQPNQVAPMAQQTSTNIVINTQPGRKAPRDWNSGLCDCVSDLSTCSLAWFCPWYLICMIAQDMGEDCFNACCYASCNPAGTFGLRVYLRGKENIRGGLFDDFNKTFGCFTSCCALAQVAREVKYIKSARGSV